MGFMSPEKSRDVRETGPWPQLLKGLDSAIQGINHYPLDEYNQNNTAVKRIAHVRTSQPNWRPDFKVYMTRNFLFHFLVAWYVY